MNQLLLHHEEPESEMGVLLADLAGVAEELLADRCHRDDPGEKEKQNQGKVY